MKNKKVLLRFSLILVLALVISSIISSVLLGRIILDQNKESMLRVISVVDYALDYSEPLQGQLRDMTMISEDENVRITIIDREGTVLADSDLESVNAMENHLEREEVRSALESGYGYATRYSQSLNQHQLYVAVLAENGQNVIRMAVKYRTVTDYLLILLPTLLIGVVVAFAISLAVTARFTDHMASDEMRRQMELMEKEKKLRQEFFSNASHELKTPITSVRGYAELLVQDFVKDEATQKDFLRRILKETDHMASLIDDILRISRLESKDAEVTLSRVQMKKVLQEVLESLQPQADSCEVSITGESEDLAIQASVQHMREILLNLISNGIKYNHPGGHVWTTIWQGKDIVYIEVKDDGVGIEAEDQKRVFERFFRVDKGRSRKLGGTGLGLSIVKHVAAYYGGEVKLTSEPGKGSRFLVEIPLSGINKV